MQGSIVYPYDMCTFLLHVILQKSYKKNFYAENAYAFEILLDITRLTSTEVVVVVLVLLK